MNGRADSWPDGSWQGGTFRSGVAQGWGQRPKWESGLKHCRDHVITMEWRRKPSRWVESNADTMGCVGRQRTWAFLLSGKGLFVGEWLSVEEWLNVIGCDLDISRVPLTTFPGGRLGWGQWMGRDCPDLKTRVSGVEMMRNGQILERSWSC